MIVPVYLRVALAVQLLFAALECTFPVLHVILPLGGNEMAQTGILICVCLVFHELVDAWKKPPDDPDRHH